MGSGKGRARRTQTTAEHSSPKRLRVNTLIVPADPLNPKVPDEHFADEASAAQAMGINVALLDDNSLLVGNVREAIAKIPTNSGQTIYRGWMIKTADYKTLVSALHEAGTTMVTQGENYQSAHEQIG